MPMKRLMILTKPVIDPEIRHKIPNCKIGPAVFATDQVQRCRSDGQSKIAEKDQIGILRLVKWASRVKVVNTTEKAVLLALATTLGLARVLIVSSDVAEEVHRPATQLLSYDVYDGSNGGLLDQLVQLVDQIADLCCILLASPRYEDHVALEMTGCLVVFAVRDLPGEIRHQESRMTEPANGVVEDLRRRK